MLRDRDPIKYRGRLLVGDPLAFVISILILLTIIVFLGSFVGLLLGGL